MSGNTTAVRLIFITNPFSYSYPILFFLRWEIDTIHIRTLARAFDSK